MSCSAEYGPQLRSLGFRVTTQRLAILHVLRHASGHLSPVEVFGQARHAVPGLTHTTVYRTLELLREAGLVWGSDQSSGHRAYELAQEHHHHLTCRRCGREVSLHNTVIDSAYKRLEASTGFKLDHQHLTLAGLCPRCLGKVSRR